MPLIQRPSRGLVTCGRSSARHAAMRVPSILVGALIGVWGCGGDATGPAPTVNVTVHATPDLTLPGQSVTVNVEISTSGQQVIDSVEVSTSGLLASSESIPVGSAGTYSVERVFHLPPDGGNGTLDILARAHAGRGTGTGSARVVVADTTPPVLSALTITPDRTLYPGDTFYVHLPASDNAGLRYSALRLSGSFTATDSLDAELSRTIDRIVRLVVPPEAALGTVLSISAEVVDAGGAHATGTLEPVAVTDSTPPTIVTGSIASAGGGIGVNPGDVLQLTVSATDNHKLAYIGYRFGAPSGARDSVAVGASAGTHTFSPAASASWIGQSVYTVFARDSIGNERSMDVTLVTVASRSRAPIRTMTLPGNIYDAAFDSWRNRLYLSQPDSSRVLVADLGSMTYATPIAITTPHGLDLSMGGDSLLVAQRSTLGVRVINLSNGAQTTLRVTDDDFYDRGPDHVRVVRNNKAIVSITFSGSGYGGSLVEADLSTGTHRNLSSVTEAVPLGVSGDRSRVVALIDDACCPEEAQIYDAGLGTIVASRGTVSRYFNQISMDYSGAHTLVNASLFDGSLRMISGYSGPAYNGEASVLASSGDVAYLATAGGVSRLRLSDGSVLETFTIGATPSRLVLSRDGLTLFAIGGGQIAVIDLW